MSLIGGTGRVPMLLDPTLGMTAGVPQDQYSVAAALGAPVPSYSSGNTQSSQHHGVGSIAPSPAASRKRGGFGGFLKTMAGYLGDELAGNNAYSEYAQQQRKAAIEAAQQQQYVAALVARGMEPSLALIMAADPSEMAKHIGTRFDAQRVDEGSSVYTPNLDGTANVFTAPKTFKEGADVTQMPASQATAPIPPVPGLPPVTIGAPQQVPGLRSPALQYADEIAQRGTQEWRNAVRDFTLKGYGPSANNMQSERLGTQRDIAYHRDATSAANNARSNQTQAGSFSYKNGGGRSGGGGRGGRSDMIGPVYQKGNQRVQFSKSAGGYVDIETGQKVQ